MLSFSLANLVFLRVWFDLLGSVGITRNSPPSPSAYWAAILDVCILGFAILGAITLAERISAGSGRVLEVALLVLLLIPLNVLRLQLTVWKVVILEAHVGRILLAPVGLIALAAAFRWRKVLAKGLIWLVLILAPLAPINFAMALWHATRQEWGQEFSVKAPAPLLARRALPARRVLWLVLDEADQARVFQFRPGSVHLPELDRLRSESVYGPNAFPPAGWTAISMPALIDGRLVHTVEPTGPSELLVRYEGSAESVPWDSKGTVFAAAHRAGVNCGLVGWWLPYCRVIGDALASCSRPDGYPPTREEGLAAFMVGDFEAVVPETVLTSRAARIRRARMTLQILEESRRLVRNRDLGLVFLHWPLPHPPGIYDRRTGRVVPSGNYLDNLELTDWALGDIRREMEKAGLWDSTDVVVTADHWWRPTLLNQLPAWTWEEAAAFRRRPDHRVPFLLKMAGQNQGYTIEESFNTVLLHDLVLDLLRGRVTDPHQAMSWIRAHRSAGRGQSLVELGH